MVGDFSNASLEKWQEKAFVNNTDYTIVSLKGENHLQARSNASASGLYWNQKIDLQRYPFLNWRWRIEKRLHGLNETTKQGDDFAGRVYAVVDGGLFIWNSNVINYVWSSNSEKLSHWPNPFAPKNEIMIALRGNDDNLSIWHTEKRNLQKDFKTFFGKDVRYIDAIALMTDTDNSGKSALTYYGDIYFSSH